MKTTANLSEIHFSQSDKTLSRKMLPKSKFNFTKKIVPYLYLLPAVVLVGIFFIYSAVYTVYVSFTKWDGINVPQFVGLDNYIQILTDEVLLGSIINTLIWVVLTLFLPVGLGLVLALEFKTSVGVLFIKTFFIFLMRSR